jgi:hypothetical protein
MKAKKSNKFQLYLLINQKDPFSSLERTAGQKSKTAIVYDLPG